MIIPPEPVSVFILTFQPQFGSLVAIKIEHLARRVGRCWKVKLPPSPLPLLSVPLAEKSPVLVAPGYLGIHDGRSLAAPPPNCTEALPP